MSSNVAKLSLSMSKTAVILPDFENTGTTISDLERELQAMCPGNCSTSSTTMVCSFAQDVPQTPLPLGIVMHAVSP